MKKLLTIMMAATLVVALTVPAMAMHFEMNGKLRVRNWALGNWVSDGTPGGSDGSTEFTDQRFRVGMMWGLTENVSLNARADILEGFWGSTLGNLQDVTSIDPATQNLIVTGQELIPSSTKSQIAFDHVYGKFTFPGAPLTVVVGRQDASWGTGAFVKSDNRDRLKLLYKTGAITLGAVYDKFAENFPANAQNSAIQDNQGFGVLAVGDVAGMKSGIIYYYGSNKASATRDQIAHSITPYIMGMAGPLNFKLEGSYAWGEVDSLNVKTDIEGLGLYAGAFYNAGMANLGLEAAYARGDDPNSSDFEGLTNMDYHGPFWSVVLYHNFDYAGFAGTTPGGADRGVTNALAVKASATASPSEKLTLIGAVVWAQCDEKNVAPCVNNQDDLGWEFDAIAVYNIYDNVAYTLGLGYLAAGDGLALDDDPWGVLNRVEIKF